LVRENLRPHFTQQLASFTRESPNTWLYYVQKVDYVNDPCCRIDANQLIRLTFTLPEDFDDKNAETIFEIEILFKLTTHTV
jgi:hypothetical protein